MRIHPGKGIEVIHDAIGGGVTVGINKDLRELLEIWDMIKNDPELQEAFKQLLFHAKIKQ